MIKLINKILRIAFSVFMVFLSVLSPMTVFAASSGSDSNYINQLPFYVGAGWGNSFSSSEISTIVNTCTSAISSNNMDSPYFPDVDAIILYDWDNTYYNFVCLSGDGLFSSNSTSFEPSYCRWASNVNGYTTQIKVTLLKSDFSFYQIGYSATMDFSNSGWFTSSPTGNYVLNAGTDLALYPVYIADDIVYNNVTYFTTFSGSGSDESFSLLDIFVQNLEDLEDSSELPDLPTPDSNDTTNTLLGKILQSLKKSNTSNIAGSFTFIQTLGDKFDNLISFFNSLYELGLDSDGNFSLLTFFRKLLFADSTTLYGIYANSDVGGFLINLKTVVNNIFGVLTVDPADHVYLTFDFSRVTYFRSVGVVTVDFDWYIPLRSQIATVFGVFFFIGMVLLYIRKIPSFFAGLSASDDK